MASYHCTVKAGGKGRAGPHADYIEREGKYAPEQAQGKSKLEDLERKSSGNMPAWAEHSAGVFWRAADEHERANGATYREIEIALPRELNPDQRRALVEDFIQQQLGDRHAYTYAIHIPKAAIEKGDQPHAHIMYSERTLDGIARDPEQYFKRANSKNPEKGGCKKDSAGTKERLLATRELWAKVQNAHLEKAGCEDRVSHLSLKARGIDRQPEKHLGPIDAKKVNAPALVESRSAERELVQVRKEVAAIDVTAELAAQHAAAAQAQREAQAAIAKAAAAAQQQADQARAQAQAAHDLATATEAKEKEDESIRNTALAAIARSSTATGRALAFAQSDHAATDTAIESSRGNINQSVRAANDRRQSLGSAIQGAERRVTRNHLEGCAPAVREQLGGVNYVLQQLVDRLPNIVKSIAAAAKSIATRKLEQLITQRVEARKAKEAAAKAPEQPTRAAQAPAKAIAPPAQEKPPTPVLVDTSAFEKTGLWRTGDLDLVQRAKDVFSQDKPDGGDRFSLSRDLSTAMGEAVRQIRATEPQASAREAERTIQTQQNAAARNAGQQEPWKAGEGNCTWHVLAAQRQRELDTHTEGKRPSGLFSGAAGKEYDAKTVSLTSQIDNIRRAAAKLEAELRAKLAEQAQQAAQNAPQHAAAQERHAGLMLLHKAVNDASRQIEAAEEKTNDRGHSDDFER